MQYSNYDYLKRKVKSKLVE